MASPQAEDGHVDIANEIVEKLAKINLSSYEWRVLWAIWRKTYGWHKKMDFVSVSQMEELTDLDRRNISRTKRLLLGKNIIISDGNLIGFNKNYDSWMLSSTQTIKIVYIDTRPKAFPPAWYRPKTSSSTLCEYCCGEIDWNNEEVNRHHILPKANGGKECNQNLATVCLNCHGKLHQQIDEYFRVYPDDRQGCYRRFVSLLSSIQTTFLSSRKTITKEKKETIQKKVVEDSQKPKRTPKTIPEDSDAYRLAALLLQKILERKPNFKKPNLQAWAKTVDRMLGADGRPAKSIENVICWCQKDDFWQNNILSPEKLRKQFDQLELKMEKETGVAPYRKPNGGSPGGAPVPEPKSLKKFREAQEQVEKEKNGQNKKPDAF